MLPLWTDCEETSEQFMNWVKDTLYLPSSPSPDPWLRDHTCVCVPSYFSHAWLFVTLWTVALQPLLSMGFFRQEHWSGLPCPSPGDLPHPEIEPPSLSLLHWQAPLPLAPPGKPQSSHMRSAFPWTFGLQHHLVMAWDTDSIHSELVS